MRALKVIPPLLGAAALVLVLVVVPAGPVGAVEVGSSAAFVAAFEDATVTGITLTSDIGLLAEPVRPLGAPDLVLDGAGHSLTAAPDSRVLSSFNPTGRLTVRDATITGGAPDGGQGAGIAWGGEVVVEGSVLSDNHAYLSGGAITAVGFVSVQGSTLVDNSASDQGSAIYVHEGSVVLQQTSVLDSTDTFPDDGVADAVHAHRNTEAAAGDVTLIESVVSGSDGRAVGAADAASIHRSTIAGNGGVGLVADGPIIVVESTIDGNDGPGILADGSVAVVFSTITDNEVGVRMGPDPLQLVVSAFAGNGTSCDLDGTTVTSQGWNVIDDLTCGVDEPTDRQEVGLDLMLGALGDHGGPTPTRVPAPGSPLVDLVGGELCTGQGTDQRGVDRPQGDACESGAVELAPADGPIPNPPMDPAAPSGPAALPRGATAPPARAVAAAPTFTG